MYLVNVIVTQICFFGSMAFFLHIFLDFGQVKIKKTLFYGGSVFVLGILFHCFQCGVHYYILVYSILMSFFVFEGKTLKKIYLHSIAVLLCFFWKLCNHVVFEFAVECLSLDWLDKIVIIEPISSMYMVIFIYIIKKNKFLCRYKLKYHESSRVLEFCSVFVMLEANFVIFVGNPIFEVEKDLYNSKVYIFLLLYLVMVCIMCLEFSIERKLNTKYYTEINSLVKKQLDSQLSYYKCIEDVTRDTMAIKHDMNNHLVVIKSLAEEEEKEELIAYIDRIMKRISTMKSFLKTGNSIVDAIINEKISVAKENNIVVDAQISIVQLREIEPVDLCVIIANSIDNSIAACEKISDPKKRKIQVIGRCDRGYFSYYVINPVVQPVTIMNNLIQTDKIDKTVHGYGLENIKKSVEKYRGKMNLECNNLFVTLDINIPIIKKSGKGERIL